MVWEKFEMKKKDCDKNRIKKPDVKTMLSEIMLHHNLLGSAWGDFHKDICKIVNKYHPVYRKGLKHWFRTGEMNRNI